MKERITIAQRQLKGGVISLFLDYRLHGKRRRENLKLYLLPEKTRIEREKNSETMKIAKAKRDSREFEIEQMEAGLKVKARPRFISFVAFSEVFANRYTKSHTINGFKSVVNKVDKFDKNVMIQEMSEDWMEKFVEFLSKKNNPNTIRKNVKTVLTVLKQAKYQGLIINVPKVVLPHPERAIREFLTIEELRKILEVEVKRPEVKNAFMFCCFTGLRYSDVISLNADMIRGDEIVIRQEKTREPVRIPITENAMKFLPEGWMTAPFIFKLPSMSVINDHVRSMAKQAGINKHVSFHVSRHTFAVLALSNGADIYTVSKLMGHTNVSTTLIYAKAVDEMRKKAMDAIPKL